MTRVGTLLAAVLLAGSAVPLLASSSSLTATLNAYPPSLNSTQQFTLTLTVQNSGLNTVSNVTPALVAVSGSAQLTPVATPASGQSISGSNGYGYFTWIYATAPCVDYLFNASASGYDGTTLTSNVSSFYVYVTCTVTTPTATPPIIAPPVQEGSASIYGNLYHPADGGFMQLNYVAPVDGVIQVDLYDRLARHVKHFERQVAAGPSTEQWDGRSDDGLLVASGIYVAYFHGPGLSKTVKFAVIK